MTLALDTPIGNYYDAVLAVTKWNKKKNTDSKPFEFGPYYAAWHGLWNSLSFGIYRNPDYREIAEGWARVCFDFTMLLQRNLGLSDDDIKSIASIKYVDNENAIFPEILKTKKFRGSYPNPTGYSPPLKNHG